VIVQIEFTKDVETSFPLIRREEFFFWDDELCVKTGVCRILSIETNRVHTINKPAELVNSTFNKAKLTGIEGKCRKLT
jgi:hypothetical protein